MTELDPLHEKAGNADERHLAPLLLPLKWLAGILLVAVMSVTVIDVAGRYFFNAPLPGGYQIITGLMALMIFAGLPLVTVRNEHLKAGLLDHLFVGRAWLAQQLVVDLAICVCFAVLTWKCAEAAQHYRQTGEKLDHTLGIPLYAIAWFVAALAAVTGLVTLHLALRRLVRRT